MRGSTRGLTELGYLLFLDRYAVKDGTRQSLRLGDTVLIKIMGQKVIGKLMTIIDGKAVVHSANQEFSVDEESIDKPIELDPAMMWERVASAVAGAETETSPAKYDEWVSKFTWLLEDWKFLPGGRILAAAGTETELTYYNCYVIPNPHDSKAGIFNTLNNMAQIMARGGGVGINLSTLRPRYAYAKATNGRSSGAVSWGEIYSYTTGLIEQGGCIIGDSLIATAQGNVPIKELVGLNPWVYSYDVVDNQVVLRRASWVRKTGIQKEVYKLRTDKGLILYATPDHLMLCRDGIYRKLGELKPGQRIMPLIRKMDRWNKDVLVQRKLGDRALKEVYDSDIPIHRFVYSEVYGEELTPDMDVHHKDGNHLNNDPYNLELLSRSEHSEYHGKQAVLEGTFVLTEYVNNLTSEQRRDRAIHANTELLKYKANNDKYADWLDERMAYKFNTANPMKTEEGVIRNKQARAINLAYQFINHGVSINTAEEWDIAIRSNLVVKTGKCHGLGITNNNDPKAYKLEAWYGCYDNFLSTLDQSNHRVELVEFSHYEDVYDMEIPGTHNFAVVMPGDQSTGGIFIHNSRRGALMLILDDWHPDVLEFIDVKRDNSRIRNANISIGISDAFMQAVENDADWELKFPDTLHEAYDELWNGDIIKWMQSGKPVKVWKKVKARDLWNAIIKSAHACAEPGIWFKDRANAYSNSQYYAPLIATNPCAEQPLPEWAVCLLGSINLSKFVGNAKGWWEVDWDNLEIAVRYAVRFLDNIIDVTPYVYPAMEEQQKSERRIGLGTMGLAEMLIRLGMRYGSDVSLQFIDKLYRFIAISAYDESCNIAQEKGTFKMYQPKILDSLFIKELPSELYDRIRVTGLRNVTLLTQAPTGTIGTMVNTSTGIEPFYHWKYERKGLFGSHVEQVKVYDEWYEHHDQNEPLPEHFVTAQELSPEEHIKVQAAVQRWIDSSISKTCNVPATYTVEQVAALYELMYKLGCKGGTVYRDQSRSEQILNLLPDSSPSSVETIATGHSSHPSTQLAVRRRPAIIAGKTYKKTTPIGTCFITVNSDDSGMPFEAFINIGKAGSDVQADAEAIGRLVSMVFRASNGNVMSSVKEVVSQLRGIGGKSVGFGPNRVSSVADALAQVLETEYLSEEIKQIAATGELCPGCGNYSVIHVEGCKKCEGCGYSAC